MGGMIAGLTKQDLRSHDPFPRFPASASSPGGQLGRQAIPLIPSRGRRRRTAPVPEGATLTRRRALTEHGGGGGGALRRTETQPSTPPRGSSGERACPRSRWPLRLHAGSGKLPGEGVGPGVKPQEGAGRPGPHAMPPRLERVANVVLRLPAVVLLDRLYRWDVQAFAEAGRPLAEQPHLRGRRLWSLYYAGHLLCAVVLLLPLRSLVNWYLHLLASRLLYAAHQIAWDYIEHETEHGFQGTVFDNPVALGHFATALTGQAVIVAVCALLLKSKRVGLLCSPLLPLAARLCCLPPQALPTVSTFAAVLTALQLLYGAASCLVAPFRMAAAACREILQDPEVYQLVTLGVSLWRRLAVPLLFASFWLVLFTLQIYASASSSSGHLLSQQGWIFIFLGSAAECCSTPYSLVGLAFAVSYLALGLLQLGKIYLAGCGASQNDDVMHRGVTEGATLLLLALQTGLLDLQLLQRALLLSLILFIVGTSTLQSMIEIAEPALLGLGASQNRSFWKHFRGVSMCLLLLASPAFLAYRIAGFFRLDFWLLILITSCVLSSLQVTGALFIYGLFMIELFQDAPVEKMDEIIYWVHAVSRVLEFLVAVGVVSYGTWESVFGEWTWMGASVITVHCYFNVWLRARSGWKSFLLRREAAEKIGFLRRATSRQLAEHDDLCAICFQEMVLAVIMPCGHFFHEGCLRKWFYVQDTCPLCHQAVRDPAAADNRGGGTALGETLHPEHRESIGQRSPADSGDDGRLARPAGRSSPILCQQDSLGKSPSCPTVWERERACLA